jgi:hypothetical protein
MGRTIAVVAGFALLIQASAPARADDPSAPGQAQMENRVADCLNEGSNAFASGGSSDEAFERCMQEHGGVPTVPASPPADCDRDCR